MPRVLPSPTPPRMASGTPSPRRTSLIVAACCLLGGGPMGFSASADTAAAQVWAARPDHGTAGPRATADPQSGSLNPCERAGIAAEQANGLPSGVLLAIGRV